MTDDDFGDFAGKSEASAAVAGHAGHADAQALHDAQAAVVAGQQWLEQQQSLLQAAGLEMRSRQSQVEEMHAEAEAKLSAAASTAAALESRSAAVRARSLEVAQIAARLAEKEETLQVEASRADELRRRLAAAERGGVARGSAESPRGGSDPPPCAAEERVLSALATETVLALEVQLLEQACARAAASAAGESCAGNNGAADSADESATAPTCVRAYAGGASSGAEQSVVEEIAEAHTRDREWREDQAALSRGVQGGWLDANDKAAGAVVVTAAVAAAEGAIWRSALRDAERWHSAAVQLVKDEKARELLLTKHRFRALLVAQEGELRRAQEQLHQQLVVQRQALPRPHADSAAPSGESATANGGGSSEIGLLATARAQAVQQAEVERWRSRAVSLEARLKGASDARRGWALREAELLERAEASERLLQAQERLALNSEYLRNTLLKA